MFASHNACGTLYHFHVRILISGCTVLNKRMSLILTGYLDLRNSRKLFEKHKRANVVAVSIGVCSLNSYCVFAGKFRAVGGGGGDSLAAGAAGTVYKYESRRGPQYRELKYNPDGNFTYFKPEHSKLKVDNENHDVATATVTMENRTVFYEFDEVQVEGNARVAFYHPDGEKNVTVMAHEVTGDKTGVIKLTARQRLFVFVVESTHTYMDAPCGFHVDEFAEIVFPTDVILRGENSVIKGRMTGVQKLALERNGKVEFSSTAHTAELPEQAQWHKDKPFFPFSPGLLVIPKVVINNLGEMAVQMGAVRAVLDIADITVKKGW